MSTGREHTMESSNGDRLDSMHAISGWGATGMPRLPAPRRGAPIADPSPYFELSNSMPGFVNATWLW